MTSGTRKPPPISTSSPREMITSRPAASALKHQQGRRRVVVDDEGGFGAGEAAQQPLGVHVAAAAGAALDVVFEVRVPARERRHAIGRRARERRAPEVRVDDDAGRVDHAAQRRRRVGGEPCRHGLLDRADQRRPSSHGPVATRCRSAAASARSASTTARPAVLRFERAHGGRWRNCSIDGMARMVCQAPRCARDTPDRRRHVSLRVGRFQDIISFSR